MQKTKKQLLGFAGLAAVGIMTAVAYAMPAAAAEEVPPSADGDVNISVTILRGRATGYLINPADKSTIMKGGDITYAYEEVSKVEVKVERLTNDGYKEVFSEEYPYDPTTHGTNSVPMSEIPGFGESEADYKVTLEFYDAQGQYANEDTSTFKYRFMKADIAKQPATNGDPILNVDINDAIDSVRVYIYRGAEPLVDKDGKQVYVDLTRDDIDPTTGRITTVLPFAENDANDGSYAIVVEAYEGTPSEGRLLSMVTLDTDYKLIKPADPNLPETPPNTGFVIGDLNISRIDYLITGLIVFGMVAGFALYLVHRKSRR